MFSAAQRAAQHAALALSWSYYVADYFVKLVKRLYYLTHVLLYDSFQSPNVTTLRSGICYRNRKFVCRLSSVTFVRPTHRLKLSAIYLRHFVP